MTLDGSVIITLGAIDPEVYRLMTGESMNAPRPVDLDDFRNSAGFHPADTIRKQVGHELFRAAMMELGTQALSLLPAGRQASLCRTALDEARHWGNEALAVGKGPIETMTDAELADRLAALRSAPEDARLTAYKAEQRGEEPSGYVSPFQSHGHDGPHLPLNSETARTRRKEREAAQAGKVDADPCYPDTQEEAVTLLDALNAYVNGRWPGAGWTPAPRAVLIDVSLTEAFARELSAVMPEEDRRLMAPRLAAIVTERAAAVEEASAVKPAVTEAEEYRIPEADQVEVNRDRFTLDGFGDNPETWDAVVTEGRGYVSVGVLCKDLALLRRVLEEAVAGGTESTGGTPFNGFHLSMSTPFQVSQFLSAVSLAAERSGMGE